MVLIMLDHNPYQDRMFAMARRLEQHYEVDADDLFQEAMLKFYDERFQGKLAEKDEPEREAYVLGATRYAMLRAAQRERALRGGYRPEDVYTYSIKAIVDLLPKAFDTQPPQAPPLDERTSAGGLASEGNNMSVMLADIRTALEKVPDAYFEILAARFECDMDVDEIAAGLGLSEDTIRKRISRAVSRVAQIANREPGVERVERRRVMRNGEAIQLTRSQQ